MFVVAPTRTALEPTRIQIQIQIQVKSKSILTVRLKINFLWVTWCIKSPTTWMTYHNPYSTQTALQNNLTRQLSQLQVFHHHVVLYSPRRWSHWLLTGLFSELGLLNKLLTPIILLSMIVGVIIGEFVPNVQNAFNTVRFDSVSVREY
jgi:hypothetical protein